jgi:hypothetical protein
MPQKWMKDVRETLEIALSSVLPVLSAIRSVLSIEKKRFLRNAKIA